MFQQFFLDFLQTNARHDELSLLHSASLSGVVTCFENFGRALATERAEDEREGASGACLVDGAPPVAMHGVVVVLFSRERLVVRVVRERAHVRVVNQHRLQMKASVAKVPISISTCTF